jgi:prefoldin subunit 5
MSNKDEKRLRNAIDRLRDEIDRLEERDAPTRARLGELVGDIERLDQGTHAAHTDRNLIQRLEDEIAMLEMTHPSLTTILNDILGILTAAGI